MFFSLVIIFKSGLGSWILLPSFRWYFYAASFWKPASDNFPKNLHVLQVSFEKIVSPSGNYQMQASKKRLHKNYEKKGGEKDPGSQAPLENNYTTKEHLITL